MSKVSKKEIRGIVEAAIKQSLTKYELPAESKKTEKLTQRFSKKLAVVIKDALKKNKKPKLKTPEKARLKKKKVTAN